MEKIDTPTRKLPVRDAARFLSVSKSWLDKKRLDGGGPPYLKLGRRVVYDLDDLERWATGNRRHHTSETNRMQGAGG
jgi:predicted DNA-binding transcriptional regulator AlpA